MSYIKYCVIISFYVKGGDAFSMLIQSPIDSDIKDMIVFDDIRWFQIMYCFPCSRHTYQFDGPTSTSTGESTFENVERLKKQYVHMLTEISLAKQSGYVSSVDSHINVPHCIL